MRKKAGGYFTVEAAMVMPIVLGTIVFIIYLLFFQYNRCLMEQDIGMLAMRGAVLQAENNQERIDKLREHADNLYDEKYIVWESGEIQLKVEKGKLKVEQSGTCIGLSDNLGKADASYENYVLSPISFIRTYRKLMGE